MTAEEGLLVAESLECKDSYVICLTALLILWLISEAYIHASFSIQLYKNKFCQKILVPRKQ
jgi:hypothetical protein